MSSIISDNNNSNISITSLPSEIMRMVLQQVDWKTIHSIRLVSKFFNDFVSSNIDNLPKPMMTGLSISSTYNPDGKIYIEFLYLHENEYIRVKDVYIPCENNETRLPEMENLLKKMDLRNVMHFEIVVTGETIVFDVLDRYFKIGMTVESLQLNIQKCPSFEGFSRFIRKIRYVTYLWLNKLCFLSQPIPVDFTLPMIDNLTNLCLVECECTKFVNSKMITNLYLNNKNLKRLLVFSNCKNVEYELIGSIKEKQEFCSDKKDCHFNCYLYLPLRSNSIHDAEIINNFPPNAYEISFPPEIDNTIIGVKRCSKCTSVYGIALSYRKSTYLNDTKCDSVFDRTLFIDDNFYIV
uniref:F-box domain-containing protein n=1 Tax=Strongyloides venezuelensis TaxID=75913 RepID=A0A0K0EWG1_STRVS